MILLTGATGTVGANMLYYLLASGQQVVATKRESSNLDFAQQVFKSLNENPQLDFERIIWVETDLQNSETLTQQLAPYPITEIYHCAALVSFDPKDESALAYFNHQLTKNLLQVAQQIGAKKFCYLSSIACLGKECSSPDSLITETDSLKVTESALSGYSRSKICAEQEVLHAHASGLDCVVVNPSVILAQSGRQASSSQLYEKLLQQRLVYTTGGTGFVDVSDVCQIAIRLMQEEVFGERFILNAENLSYKELADQLCTLRSLRKPWLLLPKGLLQVVSILSGILYGFTGRANPIPMQLVESLTGRSYYSNQKVCTRLGWRFTPVAKSLGKYGGL